MTTLNPREVALLEARVKKLSQEIRSEMNLPKAKRGDRVGQLKLLIHNIQMWIDPEREMKRIAPMMRAVEQEYKAWLKKHQNPFDITL